MRFYLLFWYHVFTCVSVRLREAANSILSCTLRYFCLSKLRSSWASWWSVKAVRALRGFFSRTGGLSRELEISRSPSSFTGPRGRKRGRVRAGRDWKRAQKKAATRGSNKPAERARAPRGLPQRLSRSSLNWNPRGLVVSPARPGPSRRCAAVRCGAVVPGPPEPQLRRSARRDPQTPQFSARIALLFFSFFLIYIYFPHLLFFLSLIFSPFLLFLFFFSFLSFSFFFFFNFYLNSF